jgi:hypothetical protein
MLKRQEVRRLCIAPSSLLHRLQPRHQLVDLDLDFTVSSSTAKTDGPLLLPLLSSLSLSLGFISKM